MDGVLLPTPEGHGAIFIGGQTLNSQSDALYELKNGDWLEMEQRLSFPREEFVSFYLPDDITNCNL